MDIEETNIVFKEIKNLTSQLPLFGTLKRKKDVQSITKELKTKLIAGGTFKDGQLILQGDHRE